MSKDVRINEYFFADSWANGYNLHPDFKKEIDYKKFHQTKEVLSGKNNKTLSEIKKKQISQEFIKLCENRMMMGGLRYGLFGEKEKSKYDHIQSAIERLYKYIETGNAEFLVDVSNLCQCEFIEHNHPNFHFESIDDGIHTKEIK